ncbi:MAG: hypothetical protein HYT37_03250 [Candidatus Sungbacteria bacterium]|nr:hypothetical protein [Candidatus Sungbacteria bacterium]
MLNQLRQMGLSENEARVYLAMLELGPSTMLQISTKAEINRPTAYVQIERLKKLGLASTQTKGKKQFFIAEDPNQLLSVIEEERKAAEHKKEELAKFLPELEALFRLSDSKPQVRFFEGREGLLRMQEDFLSTKEKHIYSIASADNVLDIFPEHPSTYISERVKHGIHSSLIYTSSRGDFLKEKDNASLRESKYVSAQDLPINIDLTIYDDKIGIAALKGKPSGTIIQHSSVADSFRSLFMLFWKLIRPTD